MRTPVRYLESILAYSETKVKSKIVPQFRHIAVRFTIFERKKSVFHFWNTDQFGGTGQI